MKMAEKTFAREVKVFVVECATILFSLGHSNARDVLMHHALSKIFGQYCPQRSEVSCHGSQEKSQESS
jgi:hypothetical protein